MKILHFPSRQHWQHESKQVSVKPERSVQKTSPSFRIGYDSLDSLLPRTQFRP